MFFRFIALSTALWRFRFCLLRKFIFRPRFLNSLRLYRGLFLFLLLLFLLFFFFFLIFLRRRRLLLLLRRRRCRRPLFLRPFLLLFRFRLFLPFLLLNFLLLDLFLFRPLLRSHFRLLFCFLVTFCRFLSSAFRALICCLTAAGCLVVCFETIGCDLEP